MGSVGVAPSSGLREASVHNAGVDKLPEEMNDMKIRDDKVWQSAPCRWFMPLFVVFSGFRMQSLTQVCFSGNGGNSGGW
jgi:hypothetical protein